MVQQEDVWLWDVRERRKEGEEEIEIKKRERDVGEECSTSAE